jgi:hypothetical protein
MHCTKRINSKNRSCTALPCALEAAHAQRYWRIVRSRSLLGCDSRDKPNEISETEKVTALYNIACCHSNMGDVRSGLLALAGTYGVGSREHRPPPPAARNTMERHSLTHVTRNRCW